MNMKRILVAGYLGAALASTALTPVSAETLRVMQGQAAEALNVPMNRAVVVESDVPFAELSIANPGIADISTLSDKSIYVLGKAPGRTTLTLLSPEGALIANVDVHVTPDIAEFKERLQQILPGEHIEVRTANDGIVLSGKVSSTAKMDRALDLATRYAPDRVSNLMVVGGTQQVMLKVRFAEMNRTVSKNFSSSVALRDNGRLRGETGSYLSGKQRARSSISVRGNANAGLAFGGPSVAWNSKCCLKRWNPRAWSALWPNQTSPPCPGKRPSSWLAANSRYPVNPIRAAFPSSTSVRCGTDLRAGRGGRGYHQPHHQRCGFVDRPGQRHHHSNGTVIPAFKRRETSTTVDMRDGDSFAIAGLLQDDFRDVNSQLPWVGDIPILGALFRTRNTSARRPNLS